MEPAESPQDPIRATAQAFCRRTWWMFLIGGIAAVLFGVLALLQPGIALLVLSIWFAVFLLVDGAANLFGAIRHRDKDGWWLAAALGVLGILIGAYLILVPPVSMLAFIYTAAFFALLLGISLLSLGWKVRQEIRGEWVLYLNGILSIAFALLLIFQVGVGGLTLVYLLAFWALVVGVLRIFAAFRMKRFAG